LNQRQQQKDTTSSSLKTGKKVQTWQIQSMKVRQAKQKNKFNQVCRINFSQTSSASRRASWQGTNQ
jgi:hypothetical protein